MSPKELLQADYVELWLMERRVFWVWPRCIDYAKINHVEDKTFFSIMTKGQLTSQRLDGDMNAASIQHQTEVWLLEDLIETTAYVNSMIEKGVSDPGINPFEYPNVWEISNLFKNEEDKEAFDAAKQLEEHLKGDRYDYWLAELTKEPKP